MTRLYGGKFQTLLVEKKLEGGATALMVARAMPMGGGWRCW